MLDFLPQGRAAALTAVGLLACVSGVAQAEPGRRDAAVPVMAMSAPAVPPVGFLDLCERSPQDCGASAQAPANLEALRTAAMQTYWANAFARRRPGPSALAENRVDWSQVFANARRSRGIPARVAQVAAHDTGPAPDAATVQAPDTGRVALASVQVDDATVAGSAASATSAGDVAATALETEAGAMTAFAASAAEDAIATAETETVVETADAATPTPLVFALDRDGWKLVNGVNRRVNRSIRQTADSRLYGVEDFWTRPSGGRGDCEDFVLAKRQALIAAGVPAEALSIAIVETRWGESHAVLLLASDKGEYVLDSLSPWVSRWDRVDYAWKERQRPGAPFDWVMAAI